MSEAKKTMQIIHHALASELIEAMRPVTVLGDDGEQRTVRASASILNVARQFLKDNGIDATGDGDENPLAKLAKDVSRFVDEDEQGEAVN